MTEWLRFTAVCRDPTLAALGGMGVTPVSNDSMDDKLDYPPYEIEFE